LHAEGFTAQIFQSAKLFARHQLARNFLHRRGDALNFHAARRGAERIAG
jgi:hypothetical protein